MKRNIKVTLEFDGTKYFGFQKQSNHRYPTIQFVLERELKLVLAEKVKLYASSRTDAGVHANNFVVSFITTSTVPLERFPGIMNRRLPDDIIVKKAEEVDMEFHARYSAKSKYYVYKVYNKGQESVFKNRHSYYFPKELDIDLMNETIKLFVGEKDFRAFSSRKADVKDYIRNVQEAYIEVLDGQILFHFKGKGFLYNMVRIMVGTLLEVGTGARSIERVKKALEDGQRCDSGKKVSPSGLYLKQVYY